MTHSDPPRLHISRGTEGDVSPPSAAGLNEAPRSDSSHASDTTEREPPLSRPYHDLQAQLLIVDDPLIRRTLRERALQLRQELTRKDQTELEDRLVDQAGVAWGWQAGLKYLLQQLDLSQRQRTELRRKFNIAFENFDCCLNELNSVRAAIVIKLSTEQATTRV